MTRYYLTRVSVEGFRGINNEGDPLVLRFDATKVSSVFADNAAGKTSVFDALCYAIRGDIPKLAELPAGQSPQKYYCNCFHSAGVGTIEIDVQEVGTANVFTVKVVRDKTGNRTVSSPTHPDPVGLLASLSEPFVMLDYRMFMKFVEDTPLVRGRSMGPLLGLTNYSKFAKGLQAAADSRPQRTDLGIETLESEIAAAQKDEEVRRDEIVAAFEAATTTKPVTKDVASQAAELQAFLEKDASLVAEVRGKKLDDIDFIALTKKLAILEGGTEKTELASVVNSMVATSSLLKNAPLEAVAEQADLLKAIEARDTFLSKTQGDVVQRLLEAGKAVVESEEWTQPKTCPLCGSLLEFAIAEHITRNLSQYEEAAAKIAEIKMLWGKALWVRRLEDLEVAPALSLPPAERLPADVRLAGASGTISKLSFEKALQHAAELEARLLSKHSDLDKKRAELEKKVPASMVEVMSKLSACERFKGSGLALSAIQSKLAVAKARLTSRERWKKFIDQAGEAFLEAEADLAKGRLTAIGTEYKEIFSEIMKTDAVSPRLERDPSGEELTVDLEGFHGKSDVSAQAVLSESFRNALAVSVFLAAAKKYSAGAKFVVFDDVTSSFDNGHQIHLMEVIRTRMQTELAKTGLQVILLTHDGWLRKYCYTQASETDAWEHQEIRGAAPVGRVKTLSTNSESAKAKALGLLDAGEVDQAKPFIREYLEYKLEQVVRTLKIPVALDFALRPDKKMISGWLDAIKDGVALHDAAKDLILEPQQVKDFEKVHASQMIANLISHFETGQTFPVTASILKSCIKNIDDVADCFRYEVSPGVRKYYRSLSSK